MGRVAAPNMPDTLPLLAAAPRHAMGGCRCSAGTCACIRAGQGPCALAPPPPARSPPARCCLRCNPPLFFPSRAAPQDTAPWWTKITLTQVVIVLSFTTIIGLMISTFFFVLSTGAIHFNE